MSSYLSIKFRWLSLVATWAVVCIHSRTDRWSDDVDWVSRIEESIAGVFHFAVPLFFLMSGYFFLRSYEKYGFVELLKRKVKSLYIPMLLWSLIGIVTCLPIRLYSGHDIPTIAEIMQLPFMILRSESAHFWYVRALMIFFVLAPIVAYIVRCKWLAGAVMILAMLLPAESSFARLHVPVAIFFFVLGVQLSKVKSRFSYKKCCSGLIICLLGLVFSFAFYRHNAIQIFLSQNMYAHYFATLLEPVFMIGTLWFGYDVIAEKKGVYEFPDVLNVLFFVYCMHLITLCWLGGILRITIGNGDFARLLGYFMLWGTFVVDIVIANIVRKYLPRGFAILAGGR